MTGLLKRTAKRVAKPALRPITRRVFLRVDVRIAPLYAELQGLRGEIGALRDNLPIVLSTISAHNALLREVRRAERKFAAEAATSAEAHAATQATLQQIGATTERLSVTVERLAEEATTLRAEAIAVIERRTGESEADLGLRMATLEERTEAIRQEMLFEFRYADGAPGLDGPAEPRVINHEKLRAAGDTPRLNLGCGRITRPEYLNVDARELPGVDIVADVRRLPFACGAVQEIFSAHLLEHFPKEALVRSLLPYWLALLRPGGVFRAVVPDADTMLAEHAAGRFSFDELRQVTFGGQEYGGDFHFTMFSQRAIVETLEAAGLTDVRLAACARRNGACYEMEVEGRQPAAAPTAHD